MKNLLDIIARTPRPQPWAEGEKIDWDDPALSQRILREHLSQEHDEASRRTVLIDQHVRWIDRKLLKGKPSRVLDLCCGPGFYTSRLARLGHACTGIDFSPAAIEYAKRTAVEDALDCSYIRQDIRSADFGTDNELVMLLFGELNVFKPADAHKLIQKSNRSLKSGGILLLEAHTFFAVREIGEQGMSWYSEQSGLFSERPHLCLTESFWDKTRATASLRHFIVDAESSSVSLRAESIQAYTKKEYKDLLKTSRLKQIRFWRAFGDIQDNDFLVITAQKQ
ncbi:MAG: class I SAM-dependent methyltransferase [Anaerolineales bacterium]|nr:class I SAM-dependent methyltransferase [Anaerolineales bacterium]